MSHLELYEILGVFLFYKVMEHWKNLELKDILYQDIDGNLLKEQWGDINSFDGYYQVSNLGRIKYTGKPYTDKIGRVTPKKPRVRVQTVGRSGYLTVILRRNGKNVNCRVHRLVAETFIENIHGKCCVNHKNLLKLDNNVNNLEWVTIRENSKHWIENDDKVLSNFIGVRYILKYNYWKAYIQIEKEEFLLGVFEDELKAKKMYEKALFDWETKGIKPTHNNRSRFSSKFKGIYFNTQTCKWVSQFFIKKEFFHIGRFDTEIEAKDAYEKVQKEYEQTGIFPIKKYASKYKSINYLREKWQANALNVGGVKKKYLGVFKTEEEAAEKVREYLGLESIEELLR